MKMKRYIVASIMAAALLSSGCGKFVRDELIAMQNEIDGLFERVRDLNKDISEVRKAVNQMTQKGFIVDVQTYEDSTHTGWTLVFDSGHFNENGEFVNDGQSQYDFYNGADGKDAKPFNLGVKYDEEEGHWYWFDYTEGNEHYIVADDGSRFRVDVKDGVTPLLKITDEGKWSISMDGGETWEDQDWPVHGKDAMEIFSDAQIFDDRIELVLAADSSVVTLLRYLPVELGLTLDGEELGESVPVAPGGTVSLDYEITGSGAAYAVLVAGTDGRLKTAIRRASATTGSVDVTCPEAFPEGGYIYITVNDGNGRSIVRVVNFVGAEPATENPGTDTGTGSGE
jgi:hypothetical protein